MKTMHKCLLITPLIFVNCTILVMNTAEVLSEANTFWLSVHIDGG